MVEAPAVRRRLEPAGHHLPERAAELSAGLRTTVPLHWTAVRREVPPSGTPSGCAA